MPMSPMTHDRVFRHVFGEPEGLPLLKNLINAYLEYAQLPLAVSLELVNPDLGPESVSEKRTVLDVLAQDETGRKINVEIQTSRKPAYLERTLFSWARLYGRQLPVGDDYESLRPVVTINFVEFNMFPGYNAIHQLRLPVTDHLVVFHVELLKLLKKPDRDLNLAEVWGKFLEKPQEDWGLQAHEAVQVFRAAHARMEDFMALTPDVVREIFEEKYELDQLTMKNYDGPQRLDSDLSNLV